MDHLIAAILEPLFAALGAFLEALLSIVVHVLLSLLLYLIAVPVSCVLFTPVVFIGALFGAGRYADKVAAGYRGICEGVLQAGCWV